MTDTNDLSTMIDHARALRHHFLADPHRPGYHFIALEGVHMPFDPNGALFWNGRYHLCYIYQDNGKHFWGHVSSLDLVHWRHHPPALGPGEGDDGIFSGGAFIDKEGVAVMTYWRLGEPDGIALATSTDAQLDRWTKHPRNPVLVSTLFGLREEGDVVYGTADPSQIWIKDGRYYMLTGNLPVLLEHGRKRGLVEHQGDTAYLFVSDDLTNWEYLHPFYQSRREWTYAFEDNMCPDFFELPASPEGGAGSGTHMLMFISHTLGTQYYLGQYADDRFNPQVHGRMSWPLDPEQYSNGPDEHIDHSVFAPESLTDARGRRIMWGWLYDYRHQNAKVQSGTSAELSLPRLLWLGEDGTLRLRPADELSMLRYNPQVQSATTVPADAAVPLEGISGDMLELEVIFASGSATRYGVKVRCAPDGSEETVIYYDAATQTLNLDTTNSSQANVRNKQNESSPLVVRDGEPLVLRVFLDKSVVEVFANERQAMARRIFPDNAASQNIALFSAGAATAATSIRAWEMMPSNPY